MAAAAITAHNRKIIPLRRPFDLPVACGLSATCDFSAISGWISLLIVYLKEGSSVVIKNFIFRSLKLSEYYLLHKSQHNMVYFTYLSEKHSLCRRLFI